MNQTSRRTFLERLAGAGAAAALIPAWRPASDLRLPDAAPDDERYWEAVKARFSFPARLVPMNAANMCPSPRLAVEAVVEATRDVDADVSFQNRGRFTALTESVRRRVALLAGADPEEIALVRNTSEANNVIVTGLDLGPGDEVLLTDQNHPSNGVAWDVRAARAGFTVRKVTLPESPASPSALVDLVAGAITPRTRVLAFSDVSNTSGLRMPTAGLCRLGRERGVHVHVDGAQTLGALALSLRDLGCDSYSASGQKWLMGPREIGVLFVRADRISALWPGVVGSGWGNGTTPSPKGARKFETLGQRNDAAVAGLAAALDLQEEIGAARIEARITALAGALMRGLAEIPRVSLRTPASPLLSHGVAVFRVEGGNHPALYERLYREHGIAGSTSGGLRLCPHVYNTMADVERAVSAVRRVV